MRGKDKCRILQEIRKRIADGNDIPYEITDCKYHGDCSGTCPKCERELRRLTEQLQKREKQGIPVKWDARGFEDSDVPEDGSESDHLQGEVTPEWEVEEQRRAEIRRICSFLEKLAAAMFRSEEESADQPNASGHNSLHTAATPNSSADGQIL